MNQILINAIHAEEIRVAVVNNKTLVNLDIESSINQKNKGNIYLGKISRVEESLEAAFINYGKDRQGFLPLKEISTLYYPKDKTQEKLKINEIIEEGQEVIVQIEKEERGNKGAALTTFISLVGTYMIFMPTKKNAINISRQVNAKDKKDLQEISKKLKTPQNCSVILRTVASGKTQEELQWEIDYLNGLWDSILARGKKPAPFLIYQESNIVIRSIRDYLRVDIDSVIIDDVNTFNVVKEFITYMLPHYLHKIKFFNTENKSLFSHIGIESRVNNVFKREVSLPSGGTIVLDPTEALTSIDINSARANKGANIEDTAYNTNIEAAKEIANQLRLRDIGGLIVIDFIDMNSSEHQKTVVKVMEKSLENDRARTYVGSISSFGLLEMSRQRISSSVSEAIHQTCDKCSGRGVTPTIPGLAIQILRQLENSCNTSHNTSEVTISSTTEVITYLLNEKRHQITALELKHNIKIILFPHGYKTFPFYEIKKKTANSDNAADKSYQKIPKKDLLPNILTHKPVTEVAELDIYLPNTPIPTKKQSLLSKILEVIFGKNKNKTSNKKTQNRRRNNKNYRNNNRKPYKGNKQGQKPRSKPNNRQGQHNKNNTTGVNTKNKPNTTNQTKTVANKTNTLKKSDSKT